MFISDKMSRNNKNECVLCYNEIIYFDHSFMTYFCQEKYINKHCFIKVNIQIDLNLIHTLYVLINMEMRHETKRFKRNRVKEYFCLKIMSKVFPQKTTDNPLKWFNRISCLFGLCLSVHDHGRLLKLHHRIHGLIVICNAINASSKFLLKTFTVNTMITIQVMYCIKTHQTIFSSKRQTFALCMKHIQVQI